MVLTGVFMALLMLHQSAAQNIRTIYRDDDYQRNAERVGWPFKDGISKTFGGESNMGMYTCILRGLEEKHDVIRQAIGYEIGHNDHGVVAVNSRFNISKLTAQEKKPVLPDGLKNFSFQHIEAFLNKTYECDDEDYECRLLCNESNYEVLQEICTKTGLLGRLHYKFGKFSWFELYVGCVRRYQGIEITAPSSTAEAIAK